jgi:hypothetical protein
MNALAFEKTFGNRIAMRSFGRAMHPARRTRKRDAPGRTSRCTFRDNLGWAMHRFDLRDADAAPNQALTEKNYFLIFFDPSLAQASFRSSRQSLTASSVSDL